MYKSLSPGAIGVGVDGLRAGLELARRHGFQGLHFSLQEAADLGVQQVLELAHGTGVRLSAWGFPLDFRAQEAAYQRSLEGLPALAAIAAGLDVRRTATWIMPGSEELTYEENFRFHVARLRPAAAILGEQGIRLGLEYVAPRTSWHGTKHPFAHTMEQMAELCSSVGENVGFLLDSWHWYCAGEDLTTLEQLVAAQVVDVHVNDAPAGVPLNEQVDNGRALPGETGVIDIGGFLRTLQGLGYDGPVMVEPFSATVNQLEPEDAVAVTAAALDRVWRQAGI
jgi:sugar phosphate isomerase/epimerase